MTLRRIETAMVLGSALMAVAVLGVGQRASALLESTEGCVAVPGLPCSYTAQTRGGFTAAGDGWAVRVARGHRTRTYRGDIAETRQDVIRPGDRVTAETAAYRASYFPRLRGIVRVGPDVTTR